MPYKYVTDNPYRLLSLSSSQGQRVLRQKSAAASQAVKVGLPGNASLLEEFGDEDLIRCSEIVRQTDSNEVQRTIFRQMWPYELPSSEPVVSSSDFLHAPPPDQHREISDILKTQYEFLGNWYSFLSAPSPERLSNALKAFAKLYSDERNDAYLQSLLVRDANSSEQEDTAYNSVIQAQNDLVQYLLFRSCASAVEALEKSDPKTFEEYIEAIRECGLDEDIIVPAFNEVIVPFGNREMEQVEKLIKVTRIRLEQDGWSPAWGNFEPEDVAKLSVIAYTFEGKLPSAALWKDIAQRRIDQIAQAMCEYASGLVSMYGDNEVPIKIYNQANRLSISNQLSEAISQNLGTMPKGLRKVSKVPMLYSLFGIGIKIYGHQPYKPHPEWYHATTYFTLLLFPIFPTKRYLLSDGPDGSKYYHAILPFQPFHKMHLIAGLLFTAFCLFSMFSQPQSTSSAVQPPVAASTNPVVSHPTITESSNESSPSSNSGTDVSGGDNEQRRTLTAQMQQLQQKIDDQKSYISSEEPRLNREEADLQTRQADWQQNHDQIETTRATINPYDSNSVTAFNASVNESNSLHENLRTAWRRYNEEVNRYNANVLEEHKLLHKYNDLKDELNENQSSAN